MAFKRKINYFELTMASGSDVKVNLATIFNHVQTLNEVFHKNRHRMSSTGELMWLSNQSLYNKSAYHCCIKLIKDEFPEVIDKLKDTTEEIPAEHDPEKGLYEETHFVIDIGDDLDKPMIAIESTMKGAKQRDIDNFLNQMLALSGSKDQLLFDAVYAFQYDSLIDRVEEVASIKMMFHRNQVPEFNKYDQATGDLLMSAVNYTNSEYITLTFAVNFQQRKKRFDTTELRQRFVNFVNILKSNPDAKDHIKKLDVRAEDKQAQGKLRLFDLIDEKVASEVLAERKRLTSQYYESSTLYNAIRQQISKDFREQK